MESPEWTAEDRALMLAWEQYKLSICPGCGQPKETAWHWDNGGYYEVADHDEFTCHACTARAQHGHNGSEKPPPVTYTTVTYTRPADDPLPGSWLEPPSGDPVAATGPHHEEGTLA